MIADAHTHYFTTFGTLKGLPPYEMVKTFQEHDIQLALLCTVEGFFGEFQRCNDELGVVTRKYPILRHQCSVNPRAGEVAVAELGRCVEKHNTVAIKFHNWLQGISAVDASMFPLMEEAARLRLPVFFHDGSPPYCTSDQVCHLAKLFPEATIVLVHFGMNDFGRQAVRAVTKYDNVFFTCCGARLDFLREALQRVGPERMLYGSDFPFGNTTGIQYSLDKLDQLDLSDDGMEKILYRNIFDLVPRLEAP